MLLADVDSKQPNLALMQLAAYARLIGDTARRIGPKSKRERGAPLEDIYGSSLFEESAPARTRRGGPSWDACCRRRPARSAHSSRALAIATPSGTTSRMAAAICGSGFFVPALRSASAAARTHTVGHPRPLSAPMSRSTAKAAHAA